MLAQVPLLFACEQTSIDASRGAQIASLPEELAHEIWRRREYNHLHLETVSGEPVLVLDPGRHNRDAGPDFLNARIQIGRTQWIGDVEIHRASSEWMQHRHDRDERYNRVVLHVVLAADLWTGALRRQDGTTLPEIALSGFLRRPLRRLLVRMHRSEDRALPCKTSWPGIPTPTVEPLLAQMAKIRLRRRAESYRTELKQAADPDEAIYSHLLAVLGYSKNREPMVELARRVPLSLLRQMGDRTDTEALLLGTAGLIPAPDDVEGSPEDVAYVDRLRSRYNLLQVRTGHPPMDRTRWRFFRLRPSNFPPTRIAQAAAWVAGGLLSRRHVAHHVLGILQKDPTPLPSLRELLTVSMSDFWLTHVRLERASKGAPGSLGRGRIDRLILNALLPAAMNVNSALLPESADVERKVMEVVRALPPEDDEITRLYDGLGQSRHTAEATQGLHELHHSLCTPKGCLGCPIGRFILAG